MKNIYKSLADFQQEVPVILKDTSGFGYKYADLPAIFEVINPLMKKHGLGFYQAVSTVTLGDTQIFDAIETVIFHIETGEKLSSVTRIPQNVQLKGMNDFQVLGSAITYIKRYALSSLLGLVTDKDTDAGGEQVKQAPSVYKTPATSTPTMTVEEVFAKAKDELEKAETLEDLNMTHDKIRKFKKFTPDQVEDLEFNYQQLSAKFDPLK